MSFQPWDQQRLMRLPPPQNKMALSKVLLMEGTGLGLRVSALAFSQFSYNLAESLTLYSGWRPLGIHKHMVSLC